MTKAEILELASRVEKASGPSRHLDTQAFILLDPDAQRIVGEKPGRFPRDPIYGPRSTYWEWALDETKDPPEFATIPAFTASVDAALSLVPEGWGFKIIGSSVKSRGASVRLWRGNGGAAREGEGATSALALTAASLRAIAGEMGG